MKRNEIKFKLENHDGKTVEIVAEVIDGKLYRMGKPILCNCTGNTSETATPFVYQDNQVVCPNCGRKSHDLYTFDDFEKNELENVHLKYFGTDYITMQDLYKITYTLPYEYWIKVSDLFMKLKPDMVDMGFFEPQFVGWVTSNPEAVEERLNVKQELRVNYQKEQQVKRQEEKKEYMNLLHDKIQNILEEFLIVETPPSPDGDKFHLEGEFVNNPLNPKNNYGGGEWFIISNDDIWYVRNNSRDGDKWEFNNVYVKGEAGAIGKKVPYSEELANKIRELK